MAISYDIDKKKWLCKCDCGKDYYAKRDWLVKEKVISCGCYNKEKSTKDITNQRFGRLVALYPTEKRTSNRRIVWHCLCDCGNYVDVSSDSLIQGNTISCGCLKSFGEEKIRKILATLEIPYIREYSFEDCINEETGKKLRFDFYLPTLNTCIEYDGSQHFYYTNKDWNTKKHYEDTVKRDGIKDDYCLAHHIHLIRIAYTDRDKISLTYIRQRLDKYISS